MMLGFKWNLNYPNDYQIKENNKISILNHELMKMPNVIITPHIAFYTREAVALIKQTTIENIQSFLAGKSINLIPVVEQSPLRDK